MRTIITFLNDKGLKAGTVYAWQGREYEGGVFSLALRQFVEHDRMLVCATPEAEQNTWPALRDLDDARIQLVRIPKGETTAEMWEMFDTLTEQVCEDETVVFDITHGFRSLPFLVFLFAAYLKSAKRVQIAAIYYGALELGKPAPVIDLSEFVTILDWLTATDRFVQMGDGRPLADLLRKGMPPGAQMRDDLEARAMGHHLRAASEAIDGVSLALWLARPLEAMRAAARLRQALEQARPDVAQRARPFRVLADQVRAAYLPFALSAPAEAVSVPASLRVQLAMVRWYLDKGQVVQAVTLAREWLVSLLVWKLHAGDLLDLKGARAPVEDALNNAVEQTKDRRRPLTPSRLDSALQSLRVLDEVGSAWSRLQQLRNDLAHCGMSEQAKLAARLSRDAQELYPILEQLSRALM